MNFIIGCSAKKKDGTMRAFEKYDGPLWKSLRTLITPEFEMTHMQVVGCKILAISVAHGIIPAWHVIEDYDETFSQDNTPGDLGGFIAEQLDSHWWPIRHLNNEPCILVAGRSYARAAEIAGLEFEFVEGGIGIKRQRMKELIQKHLSV